MYVTGKEAQLILNITTRQGLHKIVRENNVEIKKQGAGKPNLYLKSDIEKYTVANEKNIKRYKNKSANKKAEVKKKTIEEKKEKAEYKQKRGLLNNNPLNDIGQEVFNDLREQLIKNGTFEDKDISLLQAYCVSYQKYINAINQSADKMDLTVDDFGNEKPHPYFQIADKCLSQMDKIAKSLGIGVKNRVGLEIKREKKKGIFDVLNEKEEF